MSKTHSFKNNPKIVPLRRPTVADVIADARPARPPFVPRIHCVHVERSATADLSLCSKFADTRHFANGFLCLDHQRELFPAYSMVPDRMLDAATIPDTDARSERPTDLRLRGTKPLRPFTDADEDQSYFLQMWGRN